MGVSFCALGLGARRRWSLVGGVDMLQICLLPSRRPDTLVIIDFDVAYKLPLILVFLLFFLG
jgi:hypothetical protein